MYMTKKTWSKWAVLALKGLQTYNDKGNTMYAETLTFNSILIFYIYLNFIDTFF
jgi:hypothetical protein